MAHRITIDLERGEMVEQTDSRTASFPLDSPEAFAGISRAWLRAGWQTKHVYTFTWLGRPIIQLPEDMFRVQEVLHRIRPDVILETGVAHGGSLVFYASLCRAMGRGRVIGIDVEIRPDNRRAIEAHELFDRITLIEGDSAAAGVVAQVKGLIRPGEKVFVMLDGNHTKEHVLRELEAYSPLVSPGSYIVAADGIMADLVGLRRFEDDRPNDDWLWNNPKCAAEEFVSSHQDFVIEQPPCEFNESAITDPVTYWPGAWVKRVR